MTLLKIHEDAFFINDLPSLDATKRLHTITEIKCIWRDQPILRKFCMKLRFLMGGRTCLEGWPDKSGNPYWNPVRRAGHVRGPKPDSPVCQTGYSGFVRTDHWSRIQILEYFLLKANTIFLTGDKSFQFIHLWTWFDDLTWDKNIQGIWFKRQEVYGLERHLFTNG